MNSITRNFQSSMDPRDSFIIAPSLFGEDTLFNAIDIPFCEKSGNKSYYH